MQRFFTDRCFFELIGNDRFAAGGMHAGRDAANQPRTEHMIIRSDDQYPWATLIRQKCFGIKKVFNGDLGAILTVNGGFRYIQLKKLTLHYGGFGDRRSGSLTAAGDDQGSKPLLVAFGCFPDTQKQLLPRGTVGFELETEQKNSVISAAHENTSSCCRLIAKKAGVKCEISFLRRKAYLFCMLKDLTRF